MRQPNLVQVTARTEIIYAGRKPIGVRTIGYYVEEGSWDLVGGEDWELTYHKVSPDFINREDAVLWMEGYEPSRDLLLRDR